MRRISFFLSLLLLICFNGQVKSQAVFIIDSVPDYTPGEDFIYMAGDFNGWNPGNLALPNVNGDIHSGTFRLPTPLNYPIVFEYKYLNGNDWGTEETPGPEETCGTVTGTNRLVTVNNSGESLLDVFNGCNYTLSVLDNALENMQVFYENSSERLVFKQSQNSSIYNTSLYDLTGKFIRSFQIGSKQKTYFDVSGLQSGLYIVRFSGIQGEVVKKVVIR